VTVKPNPEKALTALLAGDSLRGTAGEAEVDVDNSFAG
jgi:hypothetical protein